MLKKDWIAAFVEWVSRSSDILFKSLINGSSVWQNPLNQFIWSPPSLWHQKSCRQLEMSYLKPLCLHGWAPFHKTLVTLQQAHSRLMNGAPSSPSTFPLFWSLHGGSLLLILPHMWLPGYMKSWTTLCSSFQPLTLLANAICLNIIVKPIYSAWLNTSQCLSLFIPMLLIAPMATCPYIYLIFSIFSALLELSGHIHLNTLLAIYNGLLTIINLVKYMFLSALSDIWSIPRANGVNSINIIP